MKTENTRPLAERITQGLIGRHDKTSWPITLRPNEEPAKIVANVYGNSESIEANAELIAEAFNVTHETGRTPAQLRDERAELIASLTACPDLPDDWDESNPDAFHAFTEAFTAWKQSLTS